MARTSLPSVVIWEITYGCPLRCTHCYTESGRRPSRQPPLPRMLEIADKLVAIRPRFVHIGGGEPLIVPGLLAVVERMTGAGISVAMNTSGYGLTDELASGLARSLHSIHISIDGASAAVHDRIRGRNGSFAEAIEALHKLNRLAEERKPVRFGIDCVLVRSNFDEMRRLLTEVVPQFASLEFVLFNAAVPNGLASRESYESELLTDTQLKLLNDDEFVRSLRASAPRKVLVATTDNTNLQMHPDGVRAGTAAVDVMLVEPDGLVRAMPIFEGQIGDLLRDDPEVLWQRVIERRVDPFFVAEMAGVRTMKGWAEATRRINLHFASPADMLRIRSRKPHSSLVETPE